ncbi:pimeloyl-ACP methyl ester esterase BioH, partial [Salmonella enterica subsp. enterica serovar Infantis]
NVNMPFLRFYVYLDGMVPRKIVPFLDTLWPHSTSQIMEKAAHAPFISHTSAYFQAQMTLKSSL